ncbi:hypothetical protein ACFUT3_30215 [Streptomyces cinereoruber]|uniref:hypothetical protein n=1 Tax=Streptomyces cinereoruber TaxID=67260 RepID=UPI003635CED7
MFLPPKVVANTNRYVENGPEDRSPSFKHDFPSRVDFSGGILRYSTTSAPKASVTEVKRAAAVAALKSIAKAGN